MAEDEEDGPDDLVPGDEEDEPEGHVLPALRILKDAVARSKMHPIPVIRTEERDSGPWPLISEDTMICAITHDAPATTCD
ncbi:hypothetical protein ACIBBD_35215 [Streptomyces sp. NPDC051315]|uniref:hypothetical protein n=1 Tax=Streptomyces sp. NPDC051315 TaxID=3365650 RepID=UPI0037933355